MRLIGGIAQRVMKIRRKTGRTCRLFFPSFFLDEDELGNPDRENPVERRTKNYVGSTNDFYFLFVSFFLSLFSQCWRGSGAFDEGKSVKRRFLLNRERSWGDQCEDAVEVFIRNVFVTNVLSFWLCVISCCGGAKSNLKFEKFFGRYNLIL